MRAAPVLVATVVYLAVSAATSAKSKWVEVTTPHFVVVSDAGEKRARHVAIQFETIRATFLTALPSVQASPDRIPILAVKNEKGLRAILPYYWETKGRSRPAGVFRTGFGRNDIALRIDARGADAYQLIYHEYFHAIARLNEPRMPAWLGEGLAEFWGYTLVRGDQVTIGTPSKHKLGLVRERSMIPLEEFFAVDHASPHYTERNKTTRFYAQSWALVHYLLMADAGRHREKLGNYLDLTRGGASPVDAAHRAFGDIDALRTEYRKYIRRRTFGVIDIEKPATASEEDFVVTPLSEARADARRAVFLAYGATPEHALPLVDKAFKAEPELADLFEARAMVHLRAGERDDARTWFSRASDAEGASHLAHFYTASFLSTDEQDEAARKERELLRAVAKKPRFGAAWSELAFYYGTIDDDLVRAETMARRAVAMEPRSAEYRMLVARVLHAAGNRAQAEEIADVAVSVALQADSAGANNNICWYGALTGMAQVVMPSCELAVRAHPDAPSYRDSRGLARALLGESSGAIEDFQFFVDSAENRPAELVDERREWIARMKKGEDPFDVETIARLLRLPF